MCIIYFNGKHLMENNVNKENINENAFHFYIYS